jgi:hypothetical protein
MSPEVAGKSGAGASTVLRAVRVDLNTHGEWEIELPDQSEPVRCETLGDAQRVAVPVRCAYGSLRADRMRRLHRVLRREVISRGNDLAPAHFLAQHPGRPLVISLGAAPEPQSPSCLNPPEPAREGRRDQRASTWRQQEIGSANPAPQQPTTRTTDGWAALRAKSFRTRP